MKTGNKRSIKLLDVLLGKLYEKGNKASWKKGSEYSVVIGLIEEAKTKLEKM